VTANRTKEVSQENEWARSDFLRLGELAHSKNAVKTDLFMFNRLLQLQANAELRGVTL